MRIISPYMMPSAKKYSSIISTYSRIINNIRRKTMFKKIHNNYPVAQKTNLTDGNKIKQKNDEYYFLPWLTVFVLPNALKKI